MRFNNLGISIFFSVFIVLSDCYNGGCNAKQTKSKVEKKTDTLVYEES